MRGESAQRRVRLFVAFDLPDRLVAGISAWQATALEASEWRPVTAEALHLTLVFLGSRPQQDIGAIAGLVADELPSTPPALRLRPNAVGIPRRRPRALAFEAGEAPGLDELARRLGNSLERAGLHEREQRPFWPHLTVARLRKGPAGAAAPARRTRPRIPSAVLAGEMTQPFALDRLVVYRSETLPGGSRYHPEATFTIT